MNPINPLQYQAYHHIKEQILSGELSKNTLYSQTKLALELGVSRTPMREALQCLSQDGYITVIPSKGFMIRDLTEKDMSETIQIRCAIEGFCTHLIATEFETKKSQVLLETLATLLDQQEQVLFRPNSTKAFMELDHKFHLAIVNYADNQEFSHIFQRLMYLIHLTTSTALSVPGRMEDTLQEHKNFFSYLKKGEGDSAYQLLIDHLNMPLKIDL